MEEWLETYDIENLRFSVQHLLHRPTPTWLINVTRISDNIPLGPQIWLDHEPDGHTELAAVAQKWMLTLVGNFEPEPTLCAHCSVVLVPVFGDTEYQFEDAVWVEVQGGYSMLIDPSDQPPPKAVLCGDCGRELANMYPWMAQLLKLNPEPSD